MFDRFTERARKVVALAQDEACRFNHNYIGTEHILLGLVRESEGVAARVLSNLGVDPDKVRREIVRVLGGQVTEMRDTCHSEASKYVRDSGADLVRARVEGLLVHARCGVTDEERALPQALRVDLQYTYRAGEGDELDETVDYGAIIEGVAGLLEREEFRLLETGARMVGEHVLDSLQSIWEITVRVTKLHVPIARAVSGVSVEVTFRR